MFDRSGVLAPNARSRRDCTARDAREAARLRTVKARSDGRRAAFSRRASDTGAVLMIRRHVFKAADLEGVGLFKLPQMPRGLIYATESFALKLKESQLMGLEVVQV